MQERPLFIPLVSLVAGLTTADLLGTTPPPWALAALLPLSLAAALVSRPFVFTLSLSGLFFVWGGVALHPFLRPADELARYATERPVVIEGVVDERPEGVVAGGARICVRVDRLHRDEGETAVSGRLLLTVKEGRTSLVTGDRVLFSSKIRRPRNFGLPGEVDYVRRLAYKDVFATAFVVSAEDVVLLRTGEGWRHGIDILASSLARFIDANAGKTEAGILKALLLGDKGDVPQELQNAYSRSGVSHILSISGFHVGIIFLCVYQTLFLAARRFEFPALRLNLKKTLMVVSLPVVVFYLFLSGAAPATVRSVLMIAGVVGALSLRREVEPVNSVMVAGCLILFSAPQTLFEVSFQLSFLAIWGLVVLAPPFASLLVRGGVPSRWFLLLFVASAAAIVATLVPVAYYFHQVSFVGLVANLIVVPLMGYGAVVAGFLSLPLSALSTGAAGALLWCAAWLVHLSDQVILWLARAPVVTSYAPGRFDFLLACLALGAITFARPRKLAFGLGCFLALALALRAVPAATAEEGPLEVHFLSVGQGDAALARLPDGKWMMIDGGGRAGDAEEHVGRRLLLPALCRLGVRRIDYLVLSHEHPDHLQGILYLAENFPVGEFWCSGAPSQSRDYLALRWVLSARGIPVRSIDGSSVAFTAGGAVVEPLWPLRGNPPEEANETSLVFALRHGKSSVLFTGDLGEESESGLLATGKRLQSSILKVGHHGSRHASTDAFLAAVAPQVAVISAGYRNPFGLPAPSTVTRLLRHGIKVYRTDQDGTVDALCGADGSIRLLTRWGHFN